MMYKNIYEKIINQECAYIDSGKVKQDNSNKKYEWMAIVVSMEMPDASTEKLFEKFKSNMDSPVDLPAFAELLRAVNLDIPKKRRYILKLVKKTAVDFKAFLNGDKAAAKTVEYYLDNVYEKDNTDKRVYFKAKYFLTFLFVLDTELKCKEAELILKYYLEGYCSRILRMMFKEVSKTMGLKKSTKEVIESTQRALYSTNSSENDDELTDKEKIIESLQFQVNNYKNTLELIQSMFDELKDSIDESATEAKDSAVREFFGSLNAQEYGNILDNLITVEQRLAMIRVDRVKLSPEVMPLVIIFKQLLRFIKEYGITPIDEKGREFEATYEKIALLNYQGNPYVGDKEIKKLQVIAPGWKYQNNVISLPTVQEV